MITGVFNNKKGIRRDNHTLLNEQVIPKWTI